MRPTARRLESLYAALLCLYPPRFREQYGAAMRQAFRDALADRSIARADLFRLTCADLFTSVCRENLAMLLDTLTRPLLVFNALVLASISTVLALALYAIPQQVLRQGADDPQLQLAGDLAERLERGAAPAEAVPAGQVDMARSLSPFVIVYDDQGRPLASQAQLNDATPAPPAGVFEYVRHHREERLSWQPVLGNMHPVRIAAVVLRVEHLASGGAGFVLAGRSLLQVEQRETQVRNMAGLAWIAMLGLILVVTIGFGWWTGRSV